MWRVWVRRGVCIGSWWENLRERVHLEDPGTDEKIILRRIFRKWDGGGWGCGLD
jgi:hypothetical protein